MKKTLKLMYKLIKLVKVVIVALPIMVISNCSQEKINVEDIVIENDPIAFEKKFSESLSYFSKESVKLIGYKTLPTSLEEFDVIFTMYKENPETLSNYFFDKENSNIRVYFPVESALIEHNTTLKEVSKLGEINLKEKSLAEELYVVGRKQTDKVKGVEGNIIKDGIIYLAEKNKSDHRIGNIYVFNFGEKMMMKHKSSKAKVGCMSNHGGPNCSNAFGIYKGRCTFNSGVCMDYNGWFTNCVNGLFRNFPGSDCDYALGAGHCWNEVM